MSNAKKEEVFQLVKSLERAEKRNFKLFVKRNSANQELKVITLFDILDRMQTYDEGLILKQGKNLKKAQLSNLKAHLYKQILASLRVIREGKDLSNYLHEQMEHARILYDKGLIHQALKVLSKIKELAKSYHQGTFLLQILIFEKKIESLHITRSFENRAYLLAKEIDEHNKLMARIGNLSNLSLLLYGKYINNGHARNQEEHQENRNYFVENLPKDANKEPSFYGRLYLYQSFVWYAYIQQDFLMYYRYAQKWTDLFAGEPNMIQLECLYYLKGMHHLLQAHYLNGNTQKFEHGIEKLKKFLNEPSFNLSPNNRIHAFIYVYLNEINQHLLKGTFRDGLAMVPAIEDFLTEHEVQLDSHHKLLFYYKIACLYFGSANFSNAIEYLGKIIHWKWNLRDDLQCYARLLHLISHYELGNFDILDSLARSAYRFMAKMKNLSVVEEEIFLFIRQSFKYYPEELPTALASLLKKLKRFENDPHARRAFNYLDFISWLESKLQHKPIQDIIKEKYHLLQLSRASS